MHPGAAETRIDRLRVASGEGDSLALRLKLARALSSSTLRPNTLLPSAIVCIRHLRDPLPGTIHVEHSEVQVPPAWQSAVRSSLSGLIQRAVRPVRDQVTADAEAVIFADRAELLACLTADWCDGTAAGRWWWRSLFPDMDLGRGVLLSWLEVPEYVPAALHYLAARHSVISFVRTLTAGEARALLQRMTRTFALSELQAALDLALDDTGTAMTADTGSHDQRAARPAIAQEPEARTDAGEALVARGRDDASSQVRRFPPSDALPAAPWQHWAPESTLSTLLPEQQCLLGIGLMLHRSPSVIRAAAFTQAVRRWRPASIPRERRDVRRTPVVGMSQLPSRPSGAGGRVSDGPADMMPGSLSLPIVVDRDAPRSEGCLRASISEVPVPREGGGEVVSISSQPTSSQNREAVIAPLRPLEAPDPHGFFDVVIETELGGLFYLINLSIFLGLYGDFTTPAQPGISLSIFDFMVLVGRQLLDDRLPDDPVWALLAHLACRSEGEEPGQNFKPPDSWRVPVEWLRPFPEASIWQWGATISRLRLRHPQGFWVFDVPLDARTPKQQVFQEALPYWEIVDFKLREVCTLPPGVLPPLEGWLEWLTPYIRARLCRALVPEVGEDLSELLCHHHARVTVTASHLDVILQLAELPIALRMAGLDRNPGWMPSAGRYITFHFV